MSPTRADTFAAECPHLTCLRREISTRLLALLERGAARRAFRYFVYALGVSATKVVFALLLLEFCEFDDELGRVGFSATRSTN